MAAPVYPQRVVLSLPGPDGATQAGTAANPIVAASGTNSSTTAATVASGSKTVAATGTPEKLVASATLVEGVIISPLLTNTGDVYIGFASTDGTQSIPLPVALNAPDGKKLDLSTIYVDVAVNGEGVRYSSIN
jgi:hypothetical protein